MSPPLLLVVDDGPEIGLIVQRLGKRAGQEVVCRGDVHSAWEYLRPQDRLPDLVLLDLNLPDLPGVELCRRLRATPSLNRVPLALFTHWDQGRDVAAGLEAGARFVVCKDLLTRPDAWQARIAEILTSADGRPRNASIPTGMRLPPAEALAALRQALRHPAIRFLGPDVLRVLVRRALETAPCDLQAADLLDDLESATAHPPAADALATVAGGLAEQVWCVLGAAASAPFRAALAAAIG